MLTLRVITNVSENKYLIDMVLRLISPLIIPIQTDIDHVSCCVYQIYVAYPTGYLFTKMNKNDITAFRRVWST